MPRTPMPQLWPLLAQRVAAELGLHFPAERMDDLRRGLAGAAQELGFTDTAVCAAGLLATPWTGVQVRALAGHLTIGETYFFRDAPLLDVFSRHILPEMIQQRRMQERKHLRIWSAGCCTGEEPYSLAILVEQALPDLRDWDVSILATDVNPRFLEKAKAGRYGEWSFRGAPQDLKQRYFKPDVDRRLRLIARIRERVRFAELNLVQDSYPSVASGTVGTDVVFCRNLLMYFSPQQVCGVVQRLRGSLSDGGWLIVSPGDACHLEFPGLTATHFGSAVVFRKLAPGQRADLAAACMPPATGLPLPADKPDMLSPLPGYWPAPAPAPRVGKPASAPREVARALADQGRLDEALPWCDRWIAQDQLDPAGHYVRGVVLFEKGDANGARLALQRCIYLQPGFVMAYLVLGQLTRGLGRPAEARRHFAVAGELLRALKPDELAPEAGGLTAGRLRETVEVLAAGGVGP